MDYVIDVYDSSHNCRARCDHKQANDRQTPTESHFDACLDPDGAIAGGHLIRYVSAAACSDRTDGWFVGNADRKHTGRKCRAKNFCVLSDYRSVYLCLPPAKSIQHKPYTSSASYRHQLFALETMHFKNK
ncbi:hypothetical protein CBL_07285 [Carabus blaptoides fortunei]